MITLVTTEMIILQPGHFFSVVTHKDAVPCPKVLKFPVCNGYAALYLTKAKCKGFQPKGVSHKKKRRRINHSGMKPLKYTFTLFHL